MVRANPSAQTVIILTMNKDITNTIKTTNRQVTRSAQRGAKQAIALEAKTLLVGQVKEMLGGHFPDEFYQTPIGKAVIDMGACYLCSAATQMFPTMLGANKVGEFSEHAMTGVAQESFTPLLGTVRALFAGLAEKAALVSPPSKDGDDG